MTETLNDSQSENPVFKRELFDDFERLANHSQDAIYHYDIEPQLFLFHNQKFQIFFGLENQSESITTLDQVLQSIHPEDRQQLQKSFNKSLIGGHTEGEAEYRVLYSNGSIRWLHDRWIVLRDSKGKPISFQGFIRDNTQRKLSELQFIESKQNALIGSYIVQEGKFKYVNPKFTSITGYNEEELIGADSMALVHEDYREHVRQCAVAMLKGHDLTPYEFCVLDKSHSTHWVMETVTSVSYRGKSAALGYFMDVTKLHQMRDNLSNLGLMLGTISHSLRGCLTGLKASIHLIETGFYRNRPAQIEEGLDVTKLMADRVQKLVLDILYYSKERDLEIEKVEVWRFAKEITILIETRIKAANIEFITDYPKDPGYFTIDPEIIRTALINILENAMEACIEDTRDITHQIHFTTSVDEANVYFKISDNGPGIDKEQTSKLFQLFSSSKGKRGTGIGLFVTRNAILKHGGTITVDSSPNEGAIFRITLPRKPPAHS
ncbi:MAG: PAS domain-containing protein [Desulfobacterales bacterium]|jgi:PAS domain S-box-containing protein